MEAFRSIIMNILKGDLAPVGHPIALKESDEIIFFNDGHHYFVDSGTSALALALLDIVGNYEGEASPYVIIPGYCCPDLVAACEYAGVTPLAVDCCPNDPGYDLDQLSQVLSDRVIAIIAVNFLGLCADVQKYRALINKRNLSIKIIEDHAQWFPVDLQWSSPSDYCIFSFGRGKPLSLLGGGLLLTKSLLGEEALSHIHASTRKGVSLNKIKIFNAILNPILYQCISRNPFFSIGETHFEPLSAIREMAQDNKSLLVANYQMYQLRWRFGGALSALVDFYSQRFTQYLSIEPTRFTGQWLRYPLLLDSPVKRDRVLHKLNGKGLGASRFYPAEILAISGINGRVNAASTLPNAAFFAKRLITLPIRDVVNERHQREMLTIIREFN